MMSTKVVNFAITKEVIEKAKLIVDEMKWCLDNIHLFNEAIVYTEFSSQGILWWKRRVAVGSPKKNGINLPRTLYWSVFRYIGTTTRDIRNIKLGDLCESAHEPPKPTILGEFAQDISVLQPGDVVVHEARVITAFRRFEFITTDDRCNE